MSRDLRALRDEVETRLDPTYDLVYVAYDDQLSPEQAAVIVRGDNPWEDKAFDYTQEWESEQRHMDSVDAVDNLAETILNEWRNEVRGADNEDDALEALDELEDDWRASGDREDMIGLVQERDTSDWLRVLVRHTGDVVLRVPVAELDEDADLGRETFETLDDAAREVLDRLGFAHTEHNVSEVLDAVANAGTSVLMGYLMIAVDLESVFDLPAEDCRVELRGPSLYLGNPFTGAAFTTGPLEGTYTVDRSDLRTDRDAFGYSWDEIVGGTSPRWFRGEIAKAEEVSE